MLGNMRVWICCDTLENGHMERVKGIEPSSKAWEAAVLPLNYTRIPWLIVTVRCHPPMEMLGLCLV